MKQQLPVLGIGLGKAQSWVLCLLLLGSLSAPAIVQLTGLSADPSFIDNRPPAPLPKLPRSIGDVVEFRDGVSKFIGDNFGLRAEFVKLNVLIHYWIGVSSIPAVVVGKNGWIFLKNDYGIFDQFRALDRFTDAGLDSWIDAMEQYQQWLAVQGIAFMVVVVPNQQTVYPEYMPGYANRVSPETRLDQLSRRLRERNSKLVLVDLRSTMWAARKNGLLYYQYSNHWNAMGSFVGYSAIMQQVKKLFPKVTPLQLSDFTIGASNKSWSIPPITEVEPTLTHKKSSNIVGTEVLMSVNHVNFEKTSTILDAAPSVLFYGDSFGDIGLLPHIKETFKWTITVATNWAPFPIELIKKHRPNLVIYELVERYLARQLVYDRELEADILVAKAPPLEAMLKDTGGHVGGYIDGVRLEGDKVRFYGWAVDGKAKTPANAIYVYLGGRIIGAVAPYIQRPDVTSGMTNQIAGFQVVVARDVKIQSTNRRLRFFSINPGNRVYELNINPPLLPRIEEIFKNGLPEKIAH
jgi:alginate O-acetyltransferase complex protein AlgJ